MLMALQSNPCNKQNSPGFGSKIHPNEAFLRNTLKTFGEFEDVNTLPKFEVTQTSLNGGFSCSRGEITINSDLLDQDKEFLQFFLGHEFGHFLQTSLMVRLESGLPLLKKTIKDVGNRMGKIKPQLEERNIFDDISEIGNIEDFNHLKKINPFVDNASGTSSIDKVHEWAVQRKKGLITILKTEPDFSGFKTVYSSVIKEKGVLESDSEEAKKAKTYLNAFRNYPNVLKFNNSITDYPNEKRYAEDIEKTMEAYNKNLLEQDANEKAIEYLEALQDIEEIS